MPIRPALRSLNLRATSLNESQAPCHAPRGPAGEPRGPLLLFPAAGHPGLVLWPLATLGWFSGRWPPGAGSPGAGACWDHASAPGPLPLRRQPLPGMFSAQIPGWLARWHHAQIPLRKNFPISASETSPPRSPSLHATLPHFLHGAGCRQDFVVIYFLSLSFYHLSPPLKRQLQAHCFVLSAERGLRMNEATAKNQAEE